MQPSTSFRGTAWSKALAPLACAALIACGSKPPPPPPAPPPPPPPTVVQARLVTTAALNPDLNGRPSPVVVRVYELKSTAAFDSADFFSLWDKDQGTLGPEMISRDEYSMTPNEEKEFERRPESKAVLPYLGVVAAFRDIEHTRWRASFAVPPNKTTALTIKLDAGGVSVESK